MEQQDGKSVVNEMNAGEDAHGEERDPSHTPGEPNILSARSTEESSPYADSLPIAAGLYPSTQPQYEEGKEIDLRYQGRH